MRATDLKLKLVAFYQEHRAACNIALAIIVCSAVAYWVGAR